jgi:hypothetical protein
MASSSRKKQPAPTESQPQAATPTWLKYVQRLTEGATTSAVHGLLLLGVLASRFALPDVLGGIVLNNMLAFAFSAVLFWQFRYHDVKTSLWDLAAPFGFSSFGLWGFMGILMAMRTGDLTLLGTNTLLLEGLGDLGNLDDIDGEAIVWLLIIVAIVMFAASIYFLVSFLLTLGAVQLMVLVAGTLSLQSVQFLRRRLDLQSRAKHGPRVETYNRVHHDLRALGYHLFIKGWVGAMLFYAFTAIMQPRTDGASLATSQIYFYLAWSWLYDAVLQQILRAKLLEPYMQKRDQKKKQKAKTVT